MSNQWVKWLVIPAVVGGIGLLVCGLWLLRPAAVKAMAENGLSKHLQLDAKIEDLSVTLLPRPRVAGGGLTLRVPGHPELPPFISIDHFYLDVGLLSMLRRHVETVHADGLRIAVPPGDTKNALMGRRPGTGGIRDVIIDHFVTHDAELSFVPKVAGKTPLMFAITDLEVDSVGFGLEMPFRAKLVNPTPRGLVQATGTIGPWQPDDVMNLPLAGAFTFTDADLSTINGIGGRVDATGSFKGVLTTIAVTGDATVRDFSLDLGGKPAALATTFDVVVDGTDGRTELTRVDARLGRTNMHVSGLIDNQPGPGGHDVDLSLEIQQGRIEDLLSLALDTPTPAMLGDVSVKTRLKLPPGKTRVRNRLSIAGTFGLAGARFSDPGVQQKLHDLSRRSQGKDEDETIARVLSNLKGRLDLGKGYARLGALTFDVPGARIALDGTYNLGTGALDFHGTLRMQASLSEAVGGFKSIFIKPFDAIFRKDGAGAVIPIKITGSRQAPVFGVEMGKVLGKH